MTQRPVHLLIYGITILIFLLLVAMLARGGSDNEPIPASASGLSADQRAAYWRAIAELNQAQSALNLQVESMRTTCARQGLELRSDPKGEPACLKVAPITTDPIKKDPAPTPNPNPKP